MNEIVAEYLKNTNEINRICEDAKAKINRLGLDKEKELEAIWDKRKQFDREESAIEQLYNQKSEDIDKDKHSLIVSLVSKKDAVHRIIKLLEVREKFKPISLADGEVRVHDGKFLEWCDWIHEDDYLKIRSVIGENDKPVNKYSVVAYGRCIFGEPLIKLPFSYRISLNESRMHIAQELGSFKTITEAKDCIAKKKGQVFQDTIKAVEALKAEYLDVIGKYKLSDFEELFEYHCTECRAKFKTIPENHEKKIITRYDKDNPVIETVKCVPTYGFSRELIA